MEKYQIKKDFCHVYLMFEVLQTSNRQNVHRKKEFVTTYWLGHNRIYFSLHTRRISKTLNKKSKTINYHTNINVKKKRIP